MVRTKKVTYKSQLRDVLTRVPLFCDSLLYKSMATWNMFVLYDKKQNAVNGDLAMHLFSNRLQVRIIKNACII